MNPLLDSGLPLFFLVGNDQELGLNEAGGSLPLAYRTRVRSLSHAPKAHMQKEALVSSPRTGFTWRLASDEGGYLDGLDAAPCPLCFFTTGMVAASMDSILQLARLRQIAIHGLCLVQDNFYTMQGSLLKGTMTGGARNVRLEVQVESSATDEALQMLVQDALQQSPVLGLLAPVLNSRFTLAHNRRNLPLSEDKTLDNTILPDQEELYTLAGPAESAFPDLVVHTGQLTPRAAHTTSSAGSSLQAEQDRLLHIRGICRLREDGVKEIEQHLFNPQGSIFRLLSEPAPVDGGRGRAPDALSYLSAGLGFCFMTQFGRAAAILKKPLEDYRLIQDTAFMAGDDQQPGQAEAVASHVFLNSPFEDDYAHYLLTMAEQTCFLHALCRTSLETGFSISAYNGA